MSSHRAIPACTVPRAPNTMGTTWVRHCHMRLTSTHRSPYLANFSACFLQKAGVSLLVSETDVRSVGFDLPCSGDGRIPHHYDVIRLHKPIRLMPIPPALHWNLKMPTNVPVDDGGDLTVSISVVRRCHCTTACHNVVDCLQACTAHAASGTDISMQDVVLVVPSPKSLVLSSHHQSLSCTRKARSLQPTKGLFHIHRRLLSETAILTVYRLPAPGPHTKRTVNLRKCFPRRSLEDTVRCHGLTAVQALQRVVPSQIHLHLCSKATSHALDRVPTPQCKTCTLPRSVVAPDLLHCKEHTASPRLLKGVGHHAC